MPKFETAHRIETGGTIEYDTDRLAGQGGMKRVFFTRDGCEVVAFYLTPIQDQSDLRIRRLSDVIGRFNPTRDGENLCDHWRRVFCWPTALVHHPQRGLGFVAPAYPKNFFFTEGKRKGTEKSGQWFNNIDSGSQRSFRHVHIEPSERGDLRSLVCSLLELCRAVNRMHLAGLAHSDLSENNVLFDPCRRTAMVIDVDSLVVTGQYPAEVLGTPMFIAPEVLQTRSLPLAHPSRKHPSAETDKHALAVIIYRTLLERHPLDGVRRIFGVTAEEEDERKFSCEAVYAEHATDCSNRPTPVDWIRATSLGHDVASRFEQAFVQGLTNPTLRPLPSSWIRVFGDLLDNMVRCPNPTCRHGWQVVLPPWNGSCGCCGTPLGRKVLQIEFQKPRKVGWYSKLRTLVVASGNEPTHDRLGIFRHHLTGEDSPIGEVTCLAALESNAAHQRMVLRNTRLDLLSARSRPESSNFSKIEFGKGLLLEPGVECVLRSGDVTARGRVTTV